jgi:hypothetical protein
MVSKKGSEARREGGARDMRVQLYVSPGGRGQPKFL